MNFGNIMKMQAAWSKFNATHPKVMPFMKAVEREGIKEGTIFEITVQTPEGKRMTSNIKVQQSDLELFASLRDIRE